MPNQAIRSFLTCVCLRYLLLLRLLLAHGVGTSLLYSQSIQTTGREDRKNQLSYRVTAIPLELGPERLWVEAELRNDSDKPITVFWDSTEPSIYQFDIVHEATGRRIPVGQRFFTKNTEPHAGEQQYFKTIEPGKSLKKQIALGGWQSQRCYFRQPGRYVVRPSLHVVINKVIAPETGTVKLLDEAWTGDLAAESFSIDFPLVRDQPGVGSKIVGLVVSHDGQPVSKAIVTLEYLGDINIPSKLGGFWDQIYCDENGRFEFVCVPDQVDFQIGAWHPAHSSAGRKFAFADFKKGEQPIITLPNPVTIRGTVVDSKRLPLGNVRVSCLQAEVYTDMKGRFTFVVPEKSIDQGVVVDLWQPGRVPAQQSATPQIAMSGEWEIEIVSEAELNAAGHATFIDGSPLSKMKIELKLSTLQSEDRGNDDKTNPTHTLSVETDESGSFRVVLPSKSAFQGIAIAKQQSDTGATRQWECKIPSLDRAVPLSLQFDNRGEIEFHLFGTSSLPETAKIVLSLNSVKYGNNVVWERVSVRELKKIYQSLEPGEYRMEATIENSGMDSQSTKVVIPNVEPFIGLATIKFPKLISCGIKATLLLPDGVTPARSIAVHVSGNRYYNRKFVTDGEGKLDATFLPIGKTRLTAYGEGLSPKAIEAEVTAEQTTDLGVIRLKSEAEDFGWLEGSIAFEGGGSVGGFDLGPYGAVTSNPTGNFGPGYMSHQAGTFRTRVPEGNSQIFFDVYGSGRPTISGINLIGAEVRRKLILKSNFEAGKTLHRELTVPRRESCRDVIIRWKGIDEPHLAIATDWRNNTRWVYSWRVRGHFIDKNRKVIKHESCTISSFPTEQAFILATGSHGKTDPSNMSSPYNLFAIKPVPAGHSNAEVDFDRIELGSMLIAVVEENGHAMDEYILTCHARLGNEKIPVFIYWFGRQPIQFDTDFSLMVTKYENGQVLAPNLGAAKYLVTVSHADWEHVIEIDLAASTNLSIKLQIDANGKLIDKKIVPVGMLEKQ